MLCRPRASTAAFTTDQNTPVTFPVNVQTSLADTYTLIATHRRDGRRPSTPSGNVTVDPCAGHTARHLSGRDHRAVADGPRSDCADHRRRDRHAAQPGFTLSVAPDPLSRSPSTARSFPRPSRQRSQNTGPAADTYNLTVLRSPSRLHPPRQRDQPHGPRRSDGHRRHLPACRPGQSPPWERSSRSPSPRPARPIPSLTQTQTETFTVPADRRT